VPLYSRTLRACSKSRTKLDLQRQENLAIGYMTLSKPVPSRSRSREVSSIGVQNLPERPDNRWERRRKRMAHAIFAIYWLLIFEGVLRKWVLPQFARELFFIRDPLVIWVYWLALGGRMRPQRSNFLVVGLMFGVISLPLVALQFANSPYVFSWMLSAYGWRNYFLYFPLAFFIAKYFKPQEFERLMRWTLLAAIPIGVLVYAQSQSSAFSPINQGTGTSVEEAYANGGVALGVVRTYGTFTSSPGENAFVGSLVAMILAAWLRPKVKRPLRGVALLAASAAGATCLALSGSRGAMVGAAIVLIAAIPATLLVAGRTLAFQKLLVPVLFLAAGVTLAPVVFPRAVEAFEIRWRNAGHSEEVAYGGGGIFGRMLYELGSFRFLITSTPPHGYQLGIGGNAAGIIGREASIIKNTLYDSRLLSFGRSERAAVESDWGRQIVELGPTLGILFIVFRVAFVIWLGKESVAATVRSSDPLPLLLFAFIGTYLFSGQITGHGTLNGYAWVFAGFCMAINRGSADASQKARIRPLRRFKPIQDEAAGLGPREPQIAHL
jgi:hypothetical protein